MALPRAGTTTGTSRSIWRFCPMRRALALLLLVATVPVAVTAAVNQSSRGPRLGRQPDGTVYVSTGQHIAAAAVAFPGRPIDLAMHPSGQFFAVLSKTELILADSAGVIAGSGVAFPRRVNPAFRGLAWSPDGKRLFASMEKSSVWTFSLAGKKLAAG